MNLFWLASGGVLGTFARFFLSKAAHRIWGLGFPWGTLAVNVIGCFFVGAYAGFELSRMSTNMNSKLFFVTGFCGAFTTFSALILESSELAYRGDIGRSFLNVGLNLMLGTIFFFLGLKLLERGI